MRKNKYDPLILFNSPSDCFQQHFINSYQLSRLKMMQIHWTFCGQLCTSCSLQPAYLINHPVLWFSRKCKVSVKVISGISVTLPVKVDSWSEQSALPLGVAGSKQLPLLTDSIFFLSLSSFVLSKICKTEVTSQHNRAQLKNLFPGKIITYFVIL